jgi:hypothetical protein
MKQNLGSLDRVLRGLGALAMIISGVVVPAQEAVRLGLGVTGVYLAFTALAGSCLGYRLLGRSTCSAERG